MLKVRDAVTEMADLMGISHRSNEYLTRLLRETEPAGLWPSIGIGRQGGVTVEHLINNLIANYCAPGQPSEGPRAVQEFHLLRPETTRQRVRIAAKNALDPDRYWKEEGSAKPHEGEPLLDLLWSEVLRAVFIASGRPVVESKIAPLICISPRFQGRPMTASVIWKTSEGDQITHTYGGNLDVLPGLEGRPRPALPLVIMGDYEIAALATVAAKVEEFNILQISPHPSSGRDVADDTTPETMKAAGPGSHDSPQPPDQSALVSESPRVVQTHPLNKDEPSAPQGGKQSASRLGAYEPAGWYPSTARSRHHGTSRTDAASPQTG